MGLIGFADDGFLSSVLRTRVTIPWEKSHPADADALWINGSASELMDTGLVRVTPSEIPLVSTTLDLHSMQRPYWFSLPLADPRLQVPATFDPHDARSIDHALREAEQLLLPLAVQLAVGGKLIGSGHGLGLPSYELRKDGSTIALVDVAHWIALHPRIRPHDIGDAECVPHPHRFQGSPPDFHRIGFAETLWLYARRVRLELLPEKYRTQAIMFRAVPRIPRHMLGDVDLLVLSELMAAPRTFLGLQKGTGLRPEVLAQSLTALYLAASITTDPDKAAAMQRLLRQRAWEPPQSVPEFQSMPHVQDAPVSANRRTVPATLEALRRFTRRI